MVYQWTDTHRKVGCTTAYDTSGQPGDIVQRTTTSGFHGDPLVLLPLVDQIGERARGGDGAPGIVLESCWNDNDVGTMLEPCWKHVDIM